VSPSAAVSGKAGIAEFARIQSSTVRVAAIRPPKTMNRAAAVDENGDASGSRLSVAEAGLLPAGASHLEPAGADAAQVCGKHRLQTTRLEEPPVPGFGHRCAGHGHEPRIPWDDFELASIITENEGRRAYA